MRILHVVHGFPPIDRAGAETYTYQLCREQAKRHEVFVYTRTLDRAREQYDEYDELVDGIRVRRIVNNFSDLDSFEKDYINRNVEMRFEKYLEELKPDIVHVQHMVGLSSTIAHIVRKNGIPMVATVHDYWMICPRVQLVDAFGDICEGPREGHRCTLICSTRFWAPSPVITGTPLWRFLKKVTPQPVQRFIKYRILGAPRKPVMKIDGPAPVSPEERVAIPEDLFNIELMKYNFRVQSFRGILNKMDAVIAPSEFVRRKFIDFGVYPDKVATVYHGIPRNGLDRAKTPSGGKVRFGYLGTILKHKGLDILLDAFRSLPAGKAELHVHGFGIEGEEEYIRGLKGKVSGLEAYFHGPYNQEDLPGVLSGIDVVVVPSTWYETFNIVAREAVLSGCPVIASAVGALPEFIEDGRNGFLFEPGNPSELALRMGRFIEEPDLLANMRSGEAGIKDMTEHALEIESIYGSAVKGK
ncbi:MAG TPA: glycosyltransferase family 4 protein [Nitrospirota bacterium]|jgi:glycosyltransferase involved in cell wall biosynthesis